MSAVKPLVVLLALGLVLTGCTTVTHYESRGEPRPAQAADYPIYLYPREVRVPRPYEVLGVMEIRDTPLTVFGGSFESEVAQLRKRARQIGADAVQLTAVEPPDFLHAKHRLDANLIRFTDEWENLARTETQFAAYLRAAAGRLDPIEGIWAASDPMQTRLGILRDDGRAGRDFVAFILSSRNPTWRAGDKKLELTRGERAGVYRGAFYHDDYRRKAVAFALMGGSTNVFVLPMTDADVPIVFAKE